MQAFPNILIRASAGTGKTYQLSNRFIRLLNSGVPPEQILAVTFTRMAAREILDRVMQRLAAAALDESKCRELREAVGDRTLDQPRCLDLLEQLTRQLHRLQIETMDSYFARLARSFSLELGISPGWEIAEHIEDRQIRMEAIQALLRDNAYALSSLLKMLFKGDAQRSITAQLLSLVSELHGLYCESNEDAWKKFPDYPILEVSDLNRAILALEQVELPKDSRIAKAHLEELRWAHEKDWESFIAKGNVKAIAAGNTTYYKKEYSAEALNVYQILIQHARAVLVKDLEQQTSATYKLLELFNGHYQRLKKSSRAYRFDDITYELSRFANLKSSHTNAFRLDCKISHMLVDEFQDTSLHQWKVLEPLAQQLTESDEQKSFFFTGGPTSFFCVGDTKQAIYGWRGGRAEIFDALPSQLDNLQEQWLNKSYRSSQAVIDTVNRVFTRIDQSSQLGRGTVAVEAFVKNFPEHETELKDLPGYVELATSRFRFADQQEPYALAVKRHSAKYIADIVSRCPDHSVGVLVRSNASVAQVVHGLRDLGVAVSEERGGNQLTDSAAVELILSLLQLADHPGDRIARFHLSSSVLGPEIGLTDFNDNVIAFQIAEKFRKELMLDGYGATIDRYAKFLIPHATHRQRRRLEQLVELAHNYQSMATLRPSHFVHFVEDKRVPDPIPAQVRVMTVHQAKGLEFDIVVLPDLENKIVGQFGPCVYEREGPLQPVNQVSRRCNKEIRNILPEDLLRLFDSASFEDVTDELCLLYVAMTRAAHAMHILVHPGRVTSTFTSGLLKKTLTDEKELQPEKVYYQCGDENWHEKFSSKTTTEQKTVEVLKLEKMIQFDSSEAGKTRFPLRAPSSANERKQVEASSLLNVDNLGSLTRGTLFHRWFELVQWVDDGLPQHSELRSAAASLDLGHLDLASEIKTFELSVNSGNLRTSLSRQGYDDLRAIGIDRSLAGDVELAVFTEHSFVIPDAEFFSSGMIDRVVLIAEDGKIVAADIIEFKTDLLDPSNPASIAAKVDDYGPQLFAYQQAIASSYQLDPSLIATRMAFVHYDLVHAVESNRLQKIANR